MFHGARHSRGYDTLRVSQEIPSLSWNPVDQYCVQRSLPLGRNLCQINPLQHFTLHFFMIHVNAELSNFLLALYFA